MSQYYYFHAVYLVLCNVDYYSINKSINLNSVNIPISMKTVVRIITGARLFFTVVLTVYSSNYMILNLPSPVLTASAHGRFDPLHFLCRLDETSVQAALSSRRFSKCNMFHFLGGAVAAQPLAVAKQPQRTNLLARMSDKITARLPRIGTLITAFGR
jgi:hypothetical protein